MWISRKMSIPIVLVAFMHAALASTECPDIQGRCYQVESEVVELKSMFLEMQSMFSKQQDQIGMCVYISK